jgi:hypothetical protein
LVLFDFIERADINNVTKKILTGVTGTKNNKIGCNGWD